MSEVEIKKNKGNIILRLSLQVVAIAFWLYTVIKVFVYDIDIFLINTYLPNASWIIRYKFVIILGLISIIWIFTKNITVLKWFLYIIFYPFILVFWKIPKLLITRKNWIGAFAIIGILLSFFKSVKLNVISSALLLIPIALISNFSQSSVLWVSIALLSVFIIIIYFRTFYLAFTPSLLFRIQSQVIAGFRENSKKYFELDDEVKGVPLEKMNSHQVQLWSTKLQTTVVCNRICYFLASKLRDFQKTKINVLYCILCFMLLVMLITTAFSFMNYALYKINFNNFRMSFIPNVYHFFYYSVNTLFTNSISDFSPMSPIARVLNVFEVVSGPLLLGIFFFLVITINSSRQTEELDAVVRAIHSEGQSIEVFIESEYRMPIEQAIRELEKIKAGFIKVIFFLSQNIDEGI